MGQEDMGVVESLAEESSQEVVLDPEVAVVEDLEVVVVEDLEVVGLEGQEVEDLKEMWVEVMVKVELEEEGQGIQEELAMPMEQVLEAVVT